MIQELRDEDLHIVSGGKGKEDAGTKGSQTGLDMTWANAPGYSCTGPFLPCGSSVEAWMDWMKTFCPGASEWSQADLRKEAIETKRDVDKVRTCPVPVC
ncbi:hypothetical protein [Microvirga alba]|uniref:Uncharacterized protein n=1 Tax=Microvirga alba TaxID=2791025 RepID=A0A931BPI2_9HYPH|nr:hypothetical protein [Microvirga alba]MBF9232364.1 hypothetical protein [Microvirga alba]